jgi:hypothetical protein
LRDILAAAGDGAGAPGAPGAPAGMYRWKLGVLGQWVEQYRPLSRVVEEAQA